MKLLYLVIGIPVLLLLILLSLFFPPFFWVLLFVGPLYCLGLADCFQTKHTILRNFPLVGRFRYLFESIRPEINQYFVESNNDGVPFSREQRSIVYQRSKKTLDSLPFGTQKNVYEEGYEWVDHSISVTQIDPKNLRVVIGNKTSCAKPYKASLLNIAGMSYGSLSSRAILALNGGAKDGNFAHNTGEGGISPHHLKHGGDLIWQLGTGYFGCRDKKGGFCAEDFKEKSRWSSVKMIEIKLSQGAKPSHGGVLPREKLTEEICRIRGVPPDRDVLSPATHSEFSTPLEFMHFVQKLKDLSGGKPVGFKLCVGRDSEFVSIVKAMIETEIYPDFVAVDGGEGGTGAAPLEFANNIGWPGIEGLIFVRNILVGFNVKDKVSLISSGKITTGFGIIKRLCLGADLVYAARAFMLSLGCIQALRCHSNNCPTGIATQKKSLEYGLIVKDKRQRVKNYHEETLESTAHIIGAMGVKRSCDLRPWQIIRRIGVSEVRDYDELYEFLEPGELLEASLPRSFARACISASAETFQPVE